MDLLVKNLASSIMNEDKKSPNIKTFRYGPGMLLGEMPSENKDKNTVMDKKLENLLETIVSAINEFKQSDDQVRAIAATDEPEKPILFHWDDIAEVMGVAGLSYGPSKQLEIMAKYFNEKCRPHEQIIHYPVWNCALNTMIVFPAQTYVYINNNFFFSRQLLEKAYKYNRELFKQALAPKQA